MTSEVNILEMNNVNNTWTPPKITFDEKVQILREAPSEMYKCENVDYLHIFQTEPYIDAFFFPACAGKIWRFTIRPGYIWDYEAEKFFEKHCVERVRCVASGAKLNEIYKIYSAMYPSWGLQKYRTKGVRLIDHIYSCIKGNNAKEILYRAGLDELAVYVYEMDVLNLMAKTPSSIYSGLMIKTLRSLNSPAGATILSTAYGRGFIKELYERFPDIFFEKLNEAQCKYLMTLINGGLNWWEVGNIMREKNNELRRIWNAAYFDIFMKKEAHYSSLASQAIGRFIEHAE